MEQEAWVISINMGYGHQRTAYALREIAVDNKIICANDYEGIPNRDRAFWNGSRKFYETISRFNDIPLIGKRIFKIYDKLQKIGDFYPKRNLSKAGFTEWFTYQIFSFHWGEHLIKNVCWPSAKEKAKPFISTFFIPAFMAEHYNYPGEIYCIVCDADVARGWAPLIPQKSRIKYCAPNERTRQRLALYGVPKENIFLTGYPLPMSCIGDKTRMILKNDIKSRLINLDPEKNYEKNYASLIDIYLKETTVTSTHPLTIMFAVGGAGAQKNIGIKLLTSFKKDIEKNEAKIVLVAGTKLKIKQYFEEEIKNLQMEKLKNIEIVYADNFNDYFDAFNKALSKADILWTKPSELSFYTALGVPIVIAPTIGSQEDFNKEWLITSGFGAEQGNVDYSHEWISDWLRNGHFAEMAMEGFVKEEQLGALNIKKIVFGEKE